MLGQSSLPNKNASLPLQVEADQVNFAQHVTSGNSTRFLWTALGLAVLMLLGILGCAHFSPASLAPAKLLSLAPEVATNVNEGPSFIPPLPLLHLGSGAERLTNSGAARQFVPGSLLQGSQRRVIRKGLSTRVSMIEQPAPSESRRDLLIKALAAVAVSSGVQPVLTALGSGLSTGDGVAVTSASISPKGRKDLSYIVLNNGVKLPMLTTNPEKYGRKAAEGLVNLALETGVDSIDTGTFDQVKLSVGAALKGRPRNSYFVTTGIVLDQDVLSADAYANASTKLESSLSSLGLEQVDLMLLSRQATTCAAVQEEWRALEDFYAAGKARAIGLRAYCPASLECLMRTARVTPAVNQIFYHVGMGVDPEGFKSAFDAAGIVTQSIRALDSGKLDSGELESSIGKAHGWSAAQVSIRWVLDRGVPLSMPMSNSAHMEEALGLFQDRLTTEELAQLDSATTPKDGPVLGPSSGRSSRFCPPFEDEPRVEFV